MELQIFSLRNLTILRKKKDLMIMIRCVSLIKVTNAYPHTEKPIIEMTHEKIYSLHVKVQVPAGHKDGRLNLNHQTTSKRKHEDEEEWEGEGRRGRRSTDQLPLDPRTQH